MAPFKMGSLEQIHRMVADCYEAARWYADNLGFRQVAADHFLRASVLDPTLAVAKANLHWVLTEF